jgi:hypothetical protein
MTIERNGNLIQRVVAAGEIALWVLLYAVLVLFLVALVFLHVPPAVLAVGGVLSVIGLAIWLVYRKRGLPVSATGAVAREESCSILYLHIADGVVPEQGYAIRSVLNDAETMGWWFLNPGTFTAIFPVATRGTPRSSSCQAALAQLAAAHPSWPSVGVGVAEGTIYGAFTSAGSLESMPTGKVVSLAMTRALDHAGVRTQ